MDRMRFSDEYDPDQYPDDRPTRKELEEGEYEFGPKRAVFAGEGPEPSRDEIDEMLEEDYPIAGGAAKECAPRSSDSIWEDLDEPWPEDSF